MTSLARDLRKDLEKTVKQARRAAEAGARKAVEQLGVGEQEAPRHLSGEQQALRRRLRAHGRQLGDRRDEKRGTQAIGRLVQECAYEQWHRMLFARFLAETDLLIEPKTQQSITLQEVEEWAREKDVDWLALACDFAERMLPQIFRKDDPVLDVPLPPETRSELENLLKKLPRDVFIADDSLGWVYQFWQADRKDEINKSEIKIGADELPAVTQLFTEDYMVLFLLHNTLGAWWAGKVLAGNPGLATSAPDEAALRAACKVGDIDWTYLRFVRDTAEDGTEGPWRPAAGVFEGWPKRAKDLTVLDPCMGSGHFLVFALPILVAFRMAEEGLSQSAAVDAVLRDNLFGLEIDPRCTQIAAFNLAFAAWRKVGHRPLPQLNLACSGLAIGVTKTEWLKLAEKAVTAADPAAKRDLLGVEENLLTVGLEERVKNGLEALYDLFAKAPWLGSLINPRRVGADIFREGFDKLEPLLASILAAADTDEAREMVVAAQGIAKAAQILSCQFTLVTTNVPYLTEKRQEDIVKSYIRRFFSDGKADLATAFLLRCIESAGGGNVAVVSPMLWLFLRSYRSLRHQLITSAQFRTIIRLGPNAFETSGNEVINISLVVVNGVPPASNSSFMSVDVSMEMAPCSKSHALENGSFATLDQIGMLGNPDCRITTDIPIPGTKLEEHAICMRGVVTGDSDRWTRKVWELPSVSNGWRFFQSTPPGTRMGNIGKDRSDLPAFTGRESIIDWSNRGREMLRPGTTNAAYGKLGVAVGQMGSLPVTVYTGELYDNNTAPIVPCSETILPALWAFCTDRAFFDEVRRIDSKMNVTSATFTKVPFDLAKWERVAAEKFPNGLPTPSSDDPTQWLFKGEPAGSNQPLQVAVARLLGYEWPPKNGSSNVGLEAAELDGLEAYADADGIVCLTATKGEEPAHERMTALLADAFGAEWSAVKLANLLAEVGFAGKTLDDWLRDGFFAQHCELFQQRPFIWHIWDGRRDGFHALVNYHRLAAPNGEGRRTIEKLIYSYLGDWIDRQRADQKAGVEGADARLAHAEHLKVALNKILEGEAHQNGPSYDIFVRWKPLHEQPIGWDPDINDGVRMNIRPFMIARTLNARGANACILRATPKIKWDKDRGKEPAREKADFPWFWGWDEATQEDFVGSPDFDGNRWNDLHYSRTAKQAARDHHRAKAGAKK